MSYHTYTSPYAKGVAFNYLYDSALVISGSGPINGITTGGFRPFQPSDFANISLSGASVSISAVAITGNPQVQISNTPTVVLSSPVALTGAPVVTLTGNQSVSIVGTPSVIINSGSFSLTSSVITSGQTQIPVGARAYSLAVLTGNAWVNGVGPFIAPIALGGGVYDGHWITNTAINVGLTGGYAIVAFES